ncbi:hypothetical protein EMPS_02722 [Entomortierella parvispora]|uniref:Uncharacterized protein n=1 Tax=Entomortierella parvispora TaxID=205924 RepID=A0A9P3LTU7_9FUNG|nr:hypothetical protein EMPS_02722 [Entomortierella parvispora]
MSSRFANSAAPSQQQQQHQYVPPNQYQEGHHVVADSADWNNNPYADQSMKNSVGSMSSYKGWASTDPTAYPQQQQPQHQQTTKVPPPRGSSYGRNRSNSNNSNASAGLGYGHNYNHNYNHPGGSHLSQVSNSSSIPYGHHHHQQQQQQPSLYPHYQDVTGYQPSTQFTRTDSNGTARSDGTSTTFSRPGEGSQNLHNYTQSSQGQQGQHGQQGQQGPDGLIPGYPTVDTESRYVGYPRPPQPIAPAQQQPQQPRQHRATPSDTSYISVGRTNHDPTQSIEQGPHSQGSPRMNQRALPKRRDPGNGLAAPSADGELPSLDQYEAMLQQMTSPNLGPTSPKDSRFGQRRSEYERSDRSQRQSRKQQEPPLQPPSLHQELNQYPTNNGIGGNIGVSPEDRKHRRRSSMPSSLGDMPTRIVTELKRRSSGYHSPIDGLQLSVPINESGLYGNQDGQWHNGSVQDPNLGSTSHVRQQQPHQQQQQQQQQYQSQSTISMQEDDTRSIISDGSNRHKLELEQQRRNKRNSPRLSQLGSKPPLTSKSQLRLSHTLSQSDADDVATFSNTKDTHQESPSSRPVADDSDRQMEQIELELQQLQQGISTPRNHNSGSKSATPSSARSRATTPLGMVAEEEVPMPKGAPSLQQLFASMDDGSGLQNTPNRSTTPPTRSRPTTPVTGVLPPPGPPPMTSAPLPPPPNGSPAARKGPSSNGRRGTKANVSMSTPIQPPSAPRPRAGSVASGAISIDGALAQAPPSLPLPSLPPPSQPLPSLALPGDAASQRRRKASGGRDLIQPSQQLLYETQNMYSQDSLPTPPSSLPINVELDPASSPTPPSPYSSIFSLPSSTASSPSATSAQIARIRKRINTLEKELEVFDREQPMQGRDGSDIQFQVDRLRQEKEGLEQKLALLLTEAGSTSLAANTTSISTSRPSSGGRAPMQTTLIALDQDLLQPPGVLPPAEGRSVSELSMELETLRMQLIEKEETITRMSVGQREHDQNARPVSEVRSKSKKNTTNTLNDIQRLQGLLVEQGLNSNRSSSSNAEEGQENSSLALHALQQELETLRQETASQEEVKATMARELEAFTARSQQEEAQYRTLQDTVQRLTSKVSRMEAQHASEVKQIQRDHEELLEKVVMEHANTLTDLSEQSKTDSEAQLRRWREDQEKGSDQDKQESLAREKVLLRRLEAQALKNDQLEERILELERFQNDHEEESENWLKTNKSLERQLAIEQLQQQENLYRIEQVEKENRRLRTILADLDLAAQLAKITAEGHETEDEDALYESTTSRARSKGAQDLYKDQRQKWLDRTQALERKMARSEEEATVIMQRNMELMVALEMTQSASSSVATPM